MYELPRKGPNVQGIYMKLQDRKFTVIANKHILKYIPLRTFIFCMQISQNIHIRNIKPRALMIIDENYRTRVDSLV